MPTRLPLVVTFVACIAPAVISSAQTAAPPARTSSAKSATKPATPPTSAPSTKVPATPAPVTKARQETLEEIVARVQRRLAMETPRKPHAAAPRPPVTERVKLVWRPAVVWPPELATDTPPPAPPAEQNPLNRP